MIGGLDTKIEEIKKNINSSFLDDLYQKMPNNKHSKSINSEIHEQLSQKFLSISVKDLI